VWKAGQQLAPAQRGATLVIEAATDISLMRPFLDGFRAYHPDLAILYVDMLSTQLLGDAQALRAGPRWPDLFISVATDHLVKLANDGCAQAAGLAAPDWRERGEVYAFALEPAVFVYNRRLLASAGARQPCRAGRAIARPGRGARWAYRHL
jgi:iron(III) transport system substrate-binding protein